jgi:hypothetical protein
VVGYTVRAAAFYRPMRQSPQPQTGHSALRPSAG